MMATNKALNWIQTPVSILPLVSFRMLFGIMMLLSTVRFWLKGWISSQYVQPPFHFTFMGFDWVRPMGNTGMHLIFLIIGLAALCIALGLWYRTAMVTFFLLFTYVELIDVTYYLNHYYFISVLSFIMIWLPAGRFLSLDVRMNPETKATEVPRWTIGVIRLQLAMVYFFAGLAKLNADWMLEAQPMKIWLPAKSHLPVIGSLMYKEWVAYFFSWFGACYDLCIAFFLLNRRSRAMAYVVVLAFHLATSLFFPAIGMFPYIMVVCTLIFFDTDFHLRLIGFVFGHSSVEIDKTARIETYKSSTPVLWLLSLFFVVQLLVPMRYLFYPGQLFWTEEGYRFSWRVMLMEKVGTATFYIHDPQNGKTFEVNNKEFLSTQQEKMMSTQPDLILRYAHYLARTYADRGVKKPQVHADVYVTLNGRRSAPFVDQTVDLADQQLSFYHYTWILPFNSKP